MTTDVGWLIEIVNILIYTSQNHVCLEMTPVSFWSMLVAPAKRALTYRQARLCVTMKTPRVLAVRHALAFIRVDRVSKALVQNDAVFFLFGILFRNSKLVFWYMYQHFRWKLYMSNIHAELKSVDQGNVSTYICFDRMWVWR